MRYLVWIPDHGETVADAREFDALNISMAACIAADYDHDLRGGWEWTWPVTYHVQADATDAPVYSVEVNRETVPEFYAEKPRLV